MFEANWLVFAAVLLIGLLIAWLLFRQATRPARRREHQPDVLDEGVAPARRNQALIDSPPAAAIVPPTTVDTLGGLGELIAAGAHAEVSNAEATNAEAEQWEALERATEAEAEAAPAPAAEPDDLGKLKGVGPKLVTLLGSMGVTRYAQIAAWTEADIDRIDARLGPFAGRIRRDNWVEQAHLLASGDTPGYEAKFGKL
ncbi:MAG: hypothetical protein ABIT04_03205 [Novosphingobium sp.]